MLRRPTRNDQKGGLIMLSFGEQVQNGGNTPTFTEALITQYCEHRVGNDGNLCTVYMNVFGESADNFCLLNSKIDFCQNSGSWILGIDGNSSTLPTTEEMPTGFSQILYRAILGNRFFHDRGFQFPWQVATTYNQIRGRSPRLQLPSEMQQPLTASQEFQARTEEREQQVRHDQVIESSESDLDVARAPAVSHTPSLPSVPIRSITPPEESATPNEGTPLETQPEQAPPSQSPEDADPMDLLFPQSRDREISPRRNSAVEREAVAPSEEPAPEAPSLRHQRAARESRYESQELRFISPAERARERGNTTVVNEESSVPAEQQRTQRRGTSNLPGRFNIEGLLGADLYLAGSQELESDTDYNGDFYGTANTSFWTSVNIGLIFAHYFSGASGFLLRYGLRWQDAVSRRVETVLGSRRDDADIQTVNVDLNLGYHWTPRRNLGVSAYVAGLAGWQFSTGGHLRHVVTGPIDVSHISASVGGGLEVLLGIGHHIYAALGLEVLYTPTYEKVEGETEGTYYRLHLPYVSVLLNARIGIGVR